ncbi:hypothetical protein A2U01_0069175, partial [Trifolium medium]|nr:hypothetical protein [Trifolium medium]
ILDTSWWAMVAMTIKGNISFGVPPGYSSSLNVRFGEPDSLVRLALVGLECDFRLYFEAERC